MIYSKFKIQIQNHSSSQARFFYFKILAVFLTIISFNYCFLSSSKAITLDEVQKEISNIEKETKELENKSRVYQTNINEKKKVINSLAGKISILNNRIAKLENDVYLTSQKIKLKNLLIQSLGIEIDKTFIDISEKKNILAGMIRIINDFDKKSLIEIFFEDKQFSEFFSQMQYVNLIHKSLNESLAGVKDLKNVLEDKKITSKKEKQQLEELQHRTNAQEYALSQDRSSQKELFNETKGEEKKYQKLLSATLQEKANLLKEMAELEKEANRRKNFLYYSEIGKIPPTGVKIFRWPEDHTILTQGYGMTDFARSGAYGGAGHNGIDMSAGLGSPIKAAADGEVLILGYNKGWGNWITLKHKNGTVTLYAHIIKPSFRKIGESVDAGDIIGYEGSTGFSTGSHLHFSVYYKFFTYLRNGQVYFNYFDGTLNPLNYL